MESLAAINPNLSKFRLRRNIPLLKKYGLSSFSFFKKKPLRLTVYVNDICNSRCTTCYIWKNKENVLLEPEHIHRFIDESFALFGRQQVTLTGGEPLLWPGIYGIIDYIFQKGGSAHLLTNGLLLTERVIDRLALSNIGSIAISLNSADPAIHDESRGIRGNTERIFAAVRYIREKYPEISLVFTSIIYSEL